MLLRLGAALLLLAVLSGLGATENAPERTPVPTVEELIQQLGHKDGRVREQANLALEAKGAAILPALRKARDHADPEVRRRIGALLVVLENAALLEPKRVRLRLEKKPIRDAVAEIARQTGYRLQLSPDPKGSDDHVYTFDLDNVPFWQALEKVCGEAGLVVVNSGDEDGRISLQFSDKFAPYVHHNGLVRFVANRFEYNRGVDLGGVPRNLANPGDRWESLNFHFGIMLEPRTPLLGLASVQLLEATDDLGNSMLLPPVEPGQRGRPSFHARELILEASAALALVTRAARRIKRLRGVVPLTLLVEQKPEFVVDEVLTAKNKSFKSAQTELTVQSVEKNAQDGQRFNVKFAVRNVGARSEYNFYDSIRNRFELQDAKGNKYRWSGGSWGGSDSNVSGTFGFSHPGGSAGPPAKLIFYEWTTLLHRVAFEFKDLPLP